MNAATVKKSKMGYVTKIAKRAIAMAAEHGVEWDLIDCQMDICAANSDVGLDLKKLLAFDDFNFAHDVFGIRRHMDRATAKLTGHFSPRSTARKA